MCGFHSILLKASATVQMSKYVNLKQPLNKTINYQNSSLLENNIGYISLMLNDSIFRTTGWFINQLKTPIHTQEDHAKITILN